MEFDIAGSDDRTEEVSHSQAIQFRAPRRGFLSDTQ
jgi:hypothetical protein